MFLCYRGKRFKSPPLGVSPYVLETTRTSVRGLQPRSGLMFLCPYVFRVSGCQVTLRRQSIRAYQAHKHIATLAHYQPTWLPATTLRSTVTTESESSKLTADKIMPWLSIPLIVRGAKLATKQTCLPTKSSGW